MFKKFKRHLNNVTRDMQGNYHKGRCFLRGGKFTVIHNEAAKKVSEYCVKYCPICGEELRP